MKKRWIFALLLPLLVVGAVMVGGCAADTPVIEELTVTEVTAGEASNLARDNNTNPDFVILDVRTPEEYDEGHIEGAINLDFYEDTFRDMLDELDKSTTYLLYCRSGGRSGQTLDIMNELEFSNIYHLTRGINEWKAEELPLVR